ncbi:hypothetical protein [Nostoc sp.]
MSIVDIALSGKVSDLMTLSFSTLPVLKGDRNGHNCGKLKAD